MRLGNSESPVGFCILRETGTEGRGTIFLSTDHIRRCLTEDSFRHILRELYCCEDSQVHRYAGRYLQLLDGLESTYGPHSEAALFSAPGRTEIGGNHTDHQHGCVLAAAVNADIAAAVAPNARNAVRLTSEGYPSLEVDLCDLSPRPEEQNTSAAIVRGTCGIFAEMGVRLSGLDIYAVSDVPGGSGLSSSAAFEILIGTILNDVFLAEKERLGAVRLAQIGQRVENLWFGKPCGLMDQTASSVGGAAAIDFADPSAPVVRKIDFDLRKAGLALCIVDSGADHMNLTDAYAAVPAECCQVAAACGGQFLRDIPFERFRMMLPELRSRCSDRAILRAIHFFHDNSRAREEAESLEKKDYQRFLRLVNESGDSSWEYLQNITPPGAAEKQALALTIALCRESLGKSGAVRVHGGGFAGTVQAFVPLADVNRFRAEVEAVLGAGSCHVMSIRPFGGIRLL